jgi:hypothetical protein
MKEKVETPEKIARANRQRLAAEEGVKAMEQIERDGVSIRKNMERLRVLRLQREAAAALEPVVEKPKKAKKKATPAPK